MFGLGIASKGNFLAYSTQFIFLIIRHVLQVPLETWSWSPWLCVERVPSRGIGYMELRETMYYLLCFLFIYFFACLLNNIFYISISAMFDVDSILTFIVNGVFGFSYSGFFPEASHSFQVYLGNPIGWLISSKAADCMTPFLVEVGSFVGVSQVFCLFYYSLWERLFWTNNLYGCFIILSTLFILILHGRKVFWRALFASGFLINNWYCVSCLLKINSALAV